MNIPEGWKLVPVELTEAQNVAGIYAATQYDEVNGPLMWNASTTEKVTYLNGKRQAIYKAQIAAAAPTPPDIGIPPKPPGPEPEWPEPKKEPEEDTPAQEDSWKEAILNECMAIEGCFKESEPAGTVKCLIDWHVMNERSPVQEDELRKAAEEAFNKFVSLRKRRLLGLNDFGVIDKLRTALERK